MAKTAGIEEAELRDGLRAGGQIQQVLAVARPNRGTPEFVVYLRVSWTLGYHLLRRWRGRGDRIFRTADAVLQTVWRHGYRGPIVVSRAGDPTLARFRGVSMQDGGNRSEDHQDSPVAERSQMRARAAR